MTITEIKKIMTDAFIADETVKEKYELQDGLGFEDQFSVVSIENILFFTVATAIWMLSGFFDQFKIDINQLLYSRKSHTPSWYALRAKEFQFGRQLSGDTDVYDNTGLTPEQIEAFRIIKFSAASETADQSILYLKIAGESNGVKQPVSAEQLTAFTSYINRIKDAGVRITIINAPADDLRLTMDIYYNPLVLGEDGKRLDGTSDTPVQNAIRDYISNLSFDGFYVNQSLVDKLQRIEGVEIAELKEASSRRGVQTGYTAINARSIPYAGYYRITDSNMILNFIANE